MLIDLTIRITPKMVSDAQGNEKRALVGHLGTHFDVMNKEFPLEYTERAGVVFDVRAAGTEREIGVDDVDWTRVKVGMFVAFYSGYIEREPYGSKTYFTEHPYLSMALIDRLLDVGVSIIGVDFAGVRRGKEHPPTDQKCAERGTFVIENLCNLGTLVPEAAFTACTYPMSYADMSGLPCRVIARV